LELKPTGPSVKGPAETFTGDVYFTVINKGAPPSRMNVNIVRFAPGAHTAWHSHTVGQTLHVTDGIGLVQSRGGRLIRMRPGDTVHTPPGEEPWHGATAENFMCHLVMWESAADGQGPDTAWGEPVTDDEYRAANRS